MLDFAPADTQDGKIRSLNVLTEYCSSGSMLHVLQQRPEPQQELVVVAWMSNLASGVAHLHRCKLLHNDISLRNVFVHQTSAGEVVKVGDLGLAELISADGKTSTRVCYIDGPPQSPESYRFEPYSFPHDVYCAGNVMHMIASWRARNDRDTSEAVGQHHGRRH